GEDAQGLPLLILCGRRGPASVGDPGRLLGVLLGGVGGIAAVVDRVPLVDHVRAVLVVRRLGRVAAVAGDGGPCPPDPDGGGGPPGGAPGPRIARVPGRGEGVVIPEAAADVPPLRPQRRPGGVVGAAAARGRHPARTGGDAPVRPDRRPP